MITPYFDESGAPVPFEQFPFNEVCNRLDAIDPSADPGEGMAEGLKRIIVFLLCRDSKRPPTDRDIAARVKLVGVVCSVLTAAEARDRYNFSKQSLSRALHKFRAEFGEIPSTRTRGPEVRAKLSEIQRARWRLRKEKSAAPLRETTDAKIESTNGALVKFAGGAA